MNNPLLLTALLLLVTFVGFFLAYLYGRKTTRFSWIEYVLLWILPAVFVIAFSYLQDKRLLLLYVVGGCAGFVMEYIIGLAYHKTLGRRLWYYQRYALSGGYTSWLTLPIWGIAGALFWFLIEILCL
jgi:hypothetical protein